jgi:hypothetical protein
VSRSQEDRVGHTRPRRDQGKSSVPQDIVRRLDFTFYTDPVDATLNALGL